MVDTRCRSTSDLMTRSEPGKRRLRLSTQFALRPDTGAGMTNLRTEHRLPRSTYLALAAFAALAGGCAHETLLVSSATAASGADPGQPAQWNAPPTKIDGIPFYVKRGVCKKETTWLEPQYVLTLSVAVDDEPPIFHTIVLSRSGYRSAEVQSLLALVAGISGQYTLAKAYQDACPGKIGQRWDPVAARKEYAIVDQLDTDSRLSPAERRQDVIRILNTAKVDYVVDYTRQYYLNAKSPWVGTSQVNAKLAEDGTLTEASGQLDDETASTILSTISSLVGDFTGSAATSDAATSADAAPAGQNARAHFAEINRQKAATDLARPSCPSIPGWPSPLKRLKYKFELKTDIYEHDHKAESFLLNACVPEGAGVLDGSFTISHKEANQAKKKGDAIEFDGSVSLPKSLLKSNDKGKKGLTKSD
jgi:hypothetical protein